MKKKLKNISYQKMSNHRETSCEEFETYRRIKKLIEENDSNATFRSKKRGPITTRIPLIIQSDDIKLMRYEFLTDAAKDIGVSKQILIYAHKNKRPLITKRKNGIKVFHIEWVDTC